nr:Chain P, PROTEIN (HIV-1 GP120) [synthetic construct]
HIGPGRAFGGG